MKGMRVQSIIRELRGEKIDIIPYNEDILLFAQKALSPAKVTRVQAVDMEEKRLEVIVEDTQLSLAIGKKGQNVRLASKLIGWNIDIKSEEEKRREVEAQMSEMTVASTSLNELQGVGPKTIEKLEAHGVTSIEKLADMTPEQLLEIPGIGEKMVEKIRVSVEQYFQALELQQTAAPEETAPEIVAVEEIAAPVEALEELAGGATGAETAVETETEASPDTTESLPEEVENAPESAETESAAEISGTSEQTSNQEQQQPVDEHDDKTDTDSKSLKAEDNA
jgi:transcription termination/antitermination protein NusA